uniref:Caspase-2 n=1 Tax=Xenopus tropicalis TaxID=8364 RepID=A0A803KGJ1_XENTR|eukprot:XP_012809163.1 PREDICTED: caspase-2 [Xenopus tropicalis]
MLGGMQKHHKDALQRLRVTLLHDMIIEELVEHLVSSGILTPIMHSTIMAHRSEYKQNVTLLTQLPKRGPRAFSEFCNALHATGQRHLAEQLEEEAQQQQMESVTPEVHERSFPLPVQESTPSRPRRQFCREYNEESIDDGDGPGTVQLCSVDFYLSHHQQAYKMHSCPRGRALIISNVAFETQDLDHRYGGEVDVTSLEKLFSSLGFQVEVRRNLNAQNMMSQLGAFSALPAHSALDSCVVAVLSHGLDGAVYGTDGKLVQLQDVFTAMDNAHCPQLQNKPKMFFIQACRGEEADRGVDQRDGREQSASPGCEQSDAGREDIKVRLPTQSDMICAYACLKGTVSLRNTKRGSWFVQDLVSVFSQYSKNTHVADMLVKVNALIKEREGHAPGTEFHRCKEMSEYCSTLCRDLYLFPGIGPPK